MSKENIIRAWKDPEYRSGLNAREHASLPANPAGTIDDGKLAEVAGGARPMLTEEPRCTIITYYPFCTLVLSCWV
jgi:mersacidin/lichenicidin family type 2 lantibiotic